MGISRTFIQIVGNVVEILRKSNIEYDYIQQIMNWLWTVKVVFKVLCLLECRKTRETKGND